MHIVAEFTAAQLQTVAAGRNIIFTGTSAWAAPAVTKRDDSGLIFLNGPPGCPCAGGGFADYIVSVYANLALPAGQTQNPLSVALTINGEPIAPTTATVTPGTTGRFYHVAASTHIRVRSGDTVTVTAQNVSAIPVDVSNANIIVTGEVI